MNHTSYQVEFDIEKCKSCGLCTSVCPVKIISIDDSVINKRGYSPAYIIEMNKCIGCLNCATICPDVVITVKRSVDDAKIVDERK